MPTIASLTRLPISGLRARARRKPQRASCGSQTTFFERYSSRPSGSTPASVAASLDAVKQFAAWLVLDRRTPDNPLAHLSGGNVRLDRRHDRRALAADDLRSAIQAARGSEREFRGLAGANRAVLYSIACVSGFRASELASLCPDAFDLDGDPPTITLAAEHAQRKRRVGTGASLQASRA